MSDERYQRIMEIFLEAADLEGADRGAFLDRACRGDEQLRHDVERLLAGDEEDGGLFAEENISKGQEVLAGALGIAGNGTATPEGWSPPLKERIGPYCILEKIGEGGMGAVFLAEQDHPQRRVALKMIRPGLLSESLLKRFRFEAEVLGRLRHPGIAQIYDAGEVDAGQARLPYFAMEYVEGKELRKYAEENDLGIKVRLELVARICDAVHHAHQKGIVHRDLKPENVFVVDEAATPPAGEGASLAVAGQPKVLDFGIARATDADTRFTTLQTGTGQLVGTIAYMSPEQVAGDSRQVDERSDIYALGVMLYELLAERLPFDLRHKPIPEAARIVREEEPTRLASIVASCRGDVDTIVCKAMEKDHGRRYQTAAALSSDLRRYLADEPIAAHPPSTFYQLKKFARRHKGLVMGLALSFLILILGIVTSLNYAVQAVRGERRATESKEDAQRAAIRLEITAADAVGGDDPLRGLTHLEAVPDEFRGWEWRHLHTCFESHLCEFMAGEAPGAPRLKGTSNFATSSVLHPGRGPLGAFERGDGIELIDLLSGESVAEFRSEGKLTDPELSPDGSLLAVLDRRSGKLIVEEIGSGVRKVERPVVPSQISDVSISPDGSLVAISSVTEGTEVFDTSTGQTLFLTDPFPTIAREIDFSFDGSRIAIVGGNRGDELLGGGTFFLYIYSREGERLVEKPIGDGAGALAVSPDGKRVAIGHYQRMISLYDTATLERLDVLHGHTKPISAIVFSPDGAQLASASTDGTTRVWDLASGTTLRVLTNASTPRPITSLAFSRDGEMLVGGNTYGARVWAWQRDARLVLEGHRSFVYRVVFSPDGRLIASCDWDNTICLWNALTGKRLATLPAIGARGIFSFTFDGTRLIESVLWDPATGDRVTSPRTPVDEENFKALAENRNFPVFWRQFAQGGAQASLWNDYHAALSADRSKMAKGFMSGEIQILESATDWTASQLTRHDVAVLTIAFSPDGKRLVFGDIKGVIKIWDLPGNKELATLRGHQGEVFSVNFSPDGSRIASGSNDGTIILWDTETFEQAAVLRGHGSYVHGLVFSPDGTRIVSASGDRTVRVWDTVPRDERFRQIRRAEALDEELRAAALLFLLERRY